MSRTPRAAEKPSEVPSGPLLALAPGTRLDSADRLPVSLQNLLGCQPGDRILDCPRQRAPSKLIGEQTALLVERFRSPSRIVDAVLSLSRELDMDPRALLESAFPAIQTLVEAGVLVPVKSAEAPPRWNGPVVGDRIGRFTLVRAIRNLEDTAVHLAQDERGAFAAIKTASVQNARACDALARELEALTVLRGLPVPDVIESGQHENVRYVAMNWIEGLPASARADEIRRERRDVRRRLSSLCARTADVVASVHEAGVLHGDVDSSNLLVDRSDRVYLIDFGMAIVGDEVASSRAWSFDSLEPEAAQRVLAGKNAPPTPEGEQFALGVLLYRLASGHSFRIPHARQQDALESIAGSQEVPRFTAGRCESWPEMETVLRRALAHAPRDRYPSTRAFALALQGTTAPRGRSRPRSPELDHLRDRMITTVADNEVRVGELARSTPRASLHWGMAGVAWFLYRAAQIRDDGLLLAHADRWARTARVEALRDGGLVASQTGITQSAAIRSSPIHDISGPDSVRCLIAVARQDTEELDAALANYLETLRRPVTKCELFLGEAGHLAVAATLLDALGGQDLADGQELAEELGRRLTELERRVSRLGAMGEEDSVGSLGMAHGWAGILYASMIACRQLGLEPPGFTRARLEELASLAEPVGRGVAWRGSARNRGIAAPPDYAPGWCAGSAGYVALWLEAYAAFGAERFLSLAELAGWHAWEHPDSSPNLCCGLSGRGVALLRLFRGTGDESWLERAQSLADAARSYSFEERASRFSLFRGELGLALLSLELERPETCVMPLIEPEGWLDGATRF